MDRHPKVGNGVLLGAGATLLGPITIGDGTQVGSGTLVVSDLPPNCVAVGVPARVLGAFVQQQEQQQQQSQSQPQNATPPSIRMNQILVDTAVSDGPGSITGEGMTHDKYQSSGI